MNSLTEKHFDGGVTIIEQGKANDVFYIVKSGEVGVLQNDKEIATLKARPPPISPDLPRDRRSPGAGPRLRPCPLAAARGGASGQHPCASVAGQAGQFFGERALLKDEPANATIKTNGSATCYICSRRSGHARVGSAAPPPRGRCLGLERRGGSRGARTGSAAGLARGAAGATQPV